MEFSNRQDHILKTQLNIFKVTRKRPSGVFSFPELIDQISLCETAQPYLYDDVASDHQYHEEVDDQVQNSHPTDRTDEGPRLTTRVLQKWFIGEIVVRGRGDQKMKVRHFTLPSIESRMAIYEFLKEKKLITEADLAVEDWPYASLATNFLRYMNEVTITSPTATVQTTISDEYYAFGDDGEKIQVRRLSVTKSNLIDIFEVSERTTVFKKWKRGTSSTPAHINLERPDDRVCLSGWGVLSHQYFCVYLNSKTDEAPVWREYKLLQNSNRDGTEGAVFSVLSNNGQGTIKIKNSNYYSNINAFLEFIYSSMHNVGYKIVGRNVNLLRPPMKLDTTSFLELWDCVKDPDDVDFERFAALVDAGASINNRLPRWGGTLLHRCADTLNRTCLKALIKRPDLDLSCAQ
jgi:hypothetical protein